MFASDAWGAIIEDAHRYPSPHNSQPMKIQLRSPTEATVYYDLDLGLPAESFGIPFGHVCAGVFLESVRVCARVRGYDVREDLHHNDMDFGAADRLHLIGDLTLVPRPPDAEDVASFEAFQARQTSRRPYDNTVVAPAAVEEAEATARRHGQEFRSTSDAALVRKVVHINQATLFDDLRKDAVHREILTWLRFSRAEARESGDGLSAETMLMPGPVLRFAMHHRGLWEAPVIGALIRRIYLNTMRGVRQLGWLEGPFNGPADYVAAGRTFMQIWLGFTRRNVYLHPFGTVITNPRSHTEFVQAAGATEGNGRMAWMLFRFGHSTPPPPAHRRPASAMIVDPVQELHP
ncbi:hypothetical protein [Arthrobacter sp. zg-Y1143]|uniref:hypothetical protein n=1 Tax=Arthrobacter sp. zg-Y1143 TaxID=3049065 RepID=UPI0024C21E7D|nr:hypothetical protein [Arthrobacter sp. zg-Y1143]MDK1328727.1 hypothetical protein [Arthrobacter sp. zg-Y1143]